MEHAQTCFLEISRIVDDFVSHNRLLREKRRARQGKRMYEEGKKKKKREQGSRETFLLFWCHAHFAVEGGVGTHLRVEF